MKRVNIFVGLLVWGCLSGCARRGNQTETMAGYGFPGPFTSGGVTYYPTHPGTTNYGTIDYTTNQPPAGVNPFVVVVTTNAHWHVNLIDGPGLVSTNILNK